MKSLSTWVSLENLFNTLEKKWGQSAGLYLRYLHILPIIFIYPIKSHDCSQMYIMSLGIGYFLISEYLMFTLMLLFCLVCIFEKNMHIFHLRDWWLTCSSQLNKWVTSLLKTHTLFCLQVIHMQLTDLHFIITCYFHIGFFSGKNMLIQKLCYIHNTLNGPRQN